MTQNNSVEYLQKVLREWNEFCKSHKRFEKAIQNVLLENLLLKQENEALKCQKSAKNSGRK